MENKGLKVLIEKHKNKILLIVILILLILIVGSVMMLEKNKEDFAEYNKTVKEYNVLVEECNRIKDVTILDSIELEIEANPKEKVREWLYSINKDNYDIDELKNEINELMYILLVAQQITKPEESWIIDRVKTIDGIVDIQAVTEDNDPNGQLNKEHGYTSCVYFTLKGNEKKVKGKTAIEKGTDGGGAIEVYENIEDVKNRCEYLGQFEGTLLYSGSYVAVGTMVIRTSYLLNNEEQFELTNDVIEKLTEIK